MHQVFKNLYIPDINKPVGRETGSFVNNDELLIESFQAVLYTQPSCAKKHKRDYSTEAVKIFTKIASILRYLANPLPVIGNEKTSVLSLNTDVFMFFCIVIKLSNYSFRMLRKFPLMKA